MVSSNCAPPDASKLQRSINYIAAQLRIQRKKEKLAVKSAPVLEEKENENEKEKEKEKEFVVKDLLNGFEEKMKEFEVSLDEINSDVMTAMAHLEYCRDFGKKINKLKLEVTGKIDDAVRDFDESQNYLESRFEELAEDVDKIDEFFGVLREELEQRGGGFANADEHQPKAKRKRKGEGKGRGASCSTTRGKG